MYLEDMNFAMDRITEYNFIWDIAINYIPENKKQIEAILNNESLI